MNYVKGDFTIVPNLGAAMKLVSPAINVYIALCNHADKDGGCWPAIGTIAEEIGLSESAVRRGLKTLREEGLVAVAPRKRANGGAASNYYQIIIKEVVNPPVKSDTPPLSNLKGAIELYPLEPKLRKGGEPLPLLKEIYDVFRFYSLVVENNRQVPAMCKKLIDTHGAVVARAYLVRLVERDLRKERDSEEFVPQLGNWREVINKSAKIIDYYTRTKAAARDERVYG